MTSVLYDVPGPRARRRALIGSVCGGLILAVVLGLALFQLYENGIFEGRRWLIFVDPPSATVSDVWTFLLVTGLGATVKAAAVASVLALILGLLLATLRMSAAGWVRLPSITIIELFRGLPVVLLMLFGALGLGLSIFQAVVFGLVIYNAAIIGEILRAGIVSLPRGQTEASQAIGLTHRQTLFMILLPQAVRRMLPSLISQFVVLLKDSSLGFIVGYAELLRSIQNLRDFYGNLYLFPLFFVGAAIYIAINFSLSRVAVWIERRGTKKAAGGVAHADPGGTEAHAGAEPKV